MIFNIKSKKDIVEKTKHLWKPTYCELSQGYKDSWVVIWRSTEYFGKISTQLEQKNKPTEKQIEVLLEKVLLQRLSSALNCDARKVAKHFLTEAAHAEISGCQKAIERLCTQNSDEIGKILEQVSDSNLGNELMQRCKDIACAQENVLQITEYINQGLKKFE